ncbi:glycoside hydrolase family 43 protein [Butyrivibrio sp. INlla16]|uniref:glycoside hydrolase family 43 protein n=1 Tax=Butyrivibrio sp. INlla16 TaxID=1520807 RepID=UPI00088D2DF5|nr:glycoside hydrolase family 43 protein [Butyrivibrio sp. INlla16]SDB42136.1 arabinan endo-1,5-alpha-L-arabinosidase [Butyrivibrio sp. INlla16]
MHSTKYINYAAIALATAAFAVSASCSKGTGESDKMKTVESADNSNSSDSSNLETKVEDDGMTDKAETSIKTGVYKNAVCCHDPQVILADGTYYMTGSHQVLAKSDDLKSWSYIGNGNNVFDNLFSGDLDAFKYVGKNEEGGYSVWAANTFYNETMGKYVMYFCTTSSYIKSNLCMAVSDEPGGKYTYTDTILYSGFTSSHAAETDIYDVLGEDADLSEYLKLGGYDNNKWPNCIDPAVFTDEDDRMWMVYGSWSGGIFLLELDPETGRPIHPIEEAAKGGEDAPDPYYGYKLVGGGHHAIEGPYITYSKETGYYYLFVSYGGLTSNGGYQIRQFRSENSTGPYVDAAGNRLGDEENYMSYGLKMMGNYRLPSLSVTYMAPGGQSVFQDENGEYYIVYHQRFDDGQEFHEPRIHKLFMTKDGWFTAAPFEYTGDEGMSSISEKTDVTPDMLSGTFYLLNHGLDVNEFVNKPVKCTFENGSITPDEGGEMTGGTYAINSGEPYVTITIDGVEYEGCAFTMTDEAGNSTLCISAKGNDNKTIWAVKYLQ